MGWISNLRKGTDLPTWDWLAFFPPGSSYHGTDHAYDGSRYMYWLIQYGSTGAASTTTLYRFDTWTEGWQYLATNTSGYTGISLEYDGVRNVLYLTSGNALTEWRVFNLNLTAVTIANVVCNPFVFTTITTVLPAAAGLGAGLTLVADQATDPAITGTASGGTTTTITNSAYVFTQAHVGMAVRITSGALSGQRRTISAVSTDGITATVPVAFASAVTNGTTFTVEYAQGTASAGAVGTLTDSTQSWVTNIYSNFDVVITGGTGVGQRRRIASNTGTILTLATAVTGNARTGNFATAPDATSTYKIVPSSDFLYYNSGTNGTGFYKIDVATGANATTWTTLAVTPAGINGGGGIQQGKTQNPYVLYLMRGTATANIYQYNIGLNTWTSLPTTYFVSETLDTGASMCVMENENRLLILKNSQTRLLAYRLSDGGVEPAGTMPYAAPAAYDGKRLCYVVTVDGVKWVYVLRAGGQEFFRYAIEWM